MRIQSERTQERKVNNVCHDSELATQPNPGSSLWTSAINANCLLSVYIFLTFTFNCSVFFYFISILAVRTAASSEGLLLCYWLAGPFHCPCVSDAILSTGVLNCFSLSSQIKILKRIKQAQFIFFPHRRPWKKELLVSHPNQLSQLWEKRGERSHGPQRTFSSAEAMSKAIFPYRNYCEVVSKCQERQLGYKANKYKIHPLKVK